MNILVTGATGFLGSRLVDHLSKEEPDCNIIATGRTFKADNKIIHNSVKYILGDLSDRKFVSSLFESKIDIVINCASLTSLWGSPKAFQIANITTQEYLIDESKKASISRFIYISTPSIYFNFEDAFNIKESDPTPKRKVNHYARTKFEAEELIKQSGIPYIILRPRALIGKGDNVIMPRLINANQSGRLKIIGSGYNQVNLTSVSNMVEAIRLSIHTNHLNEDYNITNGESIKLWVAINIVLKLINQSPITKKAPYWLAYAFAIIQEIKTKLLQSKKEPMLTTYSVAILAKSSTFDISKAKNQLGFVVTQNTQQALEEFAEWYNEFQADS